MAEVTDTVLKTYFETGDIPTEVQFANLIDSKTHITLRDAKTGVLATDVAAIGSTVTTLVIGTSQTLTGDVTIPSTLTLDFMPGAVLSGAHTLTMNSRPLAGDDQQIFGTDITLAWGGSVDSVSYLWWKASADSGDDALAINRCAATSPEKVVSPAGYSGTLSTEATLMGPRFIDLKGTLVADFDTGPALTIGFNSNSGAPVDFYVQWVSSSGTTNPDIRVQGVQGGRVKIGYAGYVQLYADGSDTTKDSIGYSTFEIGYTPKLVFFDENTGSPGSAWINDNLFVGGRFATILIGTAGEYEHSQNTFLKPTVEGGSITIATGNKNRFYDVRTESGATVTFGADTWGNVVYDSYVPHGQTIEGSATVTNNGDKTNQVISTVKETLVVNTLTIDKHTKAAGGSNEWGGTLFTGGLDYIETWAANDAFISGIVPAKSAIAVSVVCGQTAIRPQIWIYDSAGAGITGEDYGIWTDQGSGGYWPSTNTAGGTFMLDDPDIAFMKVVARVGTTAIYERMVITVYSLNGVIDADSFSWDGFLESARRPLISDGAPVIGDAKVGMVISDYTTPQQLMCTSRVATTLSGAEISTATVIDVADATGITTSHYLGVVVDDHTTHWSAISSITDNAITIAVGLSSAGASGADVVGILWEAI